MSASFMLHATQVSLFMSFMKLESIPHTHYLLYIKDYPVATDYPPDRILYNVTA